jgi:MFS transporter, PPP family, 3-phenylpropionic acid transporter
MKRTSDKLLSLQIAGLQGFYWMIYCPISSFASVYLLSKNFSNQNIGWVMAISNVLAVILQPALGTLIDRAAKISLRTVMCILSSLCLAMLAGLIFLDTGLLWMAVLYVGVVALLLTLQPLVNALTFEFINAGRNVSFGLTRAMGSICFAVLSTLLGLWVNRYSTDILPIVCMILFAGFFLLVLSFPRVSKQTTPQPFVKIAANQPAAEPKVGFLRKYERFIPFLIGIAFLFFFHTIINTYLAQIMTSVGGKETDIGVSLTIAAVCELPAFLGFSFLVSRFNTRSLLMFSAVVYVLRGFIFMLAASVWMINIGQVLQGLSFAVYIPAAVYYINHLMKDKDKVKGQTFITGTMTLGGVAGSVVGGWLLDHYNVHMMLIFGAAAAVIGCLLMIYSVSKPKAANAAPVMGE